MRYITDRIGIVAGICLAALIYTFIIANKAGLKVLHSPTEIIVVKAGDGFNLCRYVSYSRSSTITISRAFTQTREGNIENTISFPNVTVYRDSGDKTICRWVEVPSFVSEGEWIVRTYVTEHTKPFWENTKEIDKVNIKVTK